jgi:hypothetical protein
MSYAKFASLLLEAIPGVPRTPGVKSPSQDDQAKPQGFVKRKTSELGKFLGDVSQDATILGVGGATENIGLRALAKRAGTRAVQKSFPKRIIGRLAGSNAAHMLPGGSLKHDVIGAAMFGGGLGAADYGWKRWVRKPDKD